MISCNKDELFTEPIIEEEKETPIDTEDPSDDGDDHDATLPCDFTLDNLDPNATVIIDCILDLGGETVNLPANVTIDFEGGDIINGTINFSEGSIIDGHLLNSTLTIGGSSPQLKDPTFNFDPKRWGIVEGETTSEIALRNNKILEEAMEMSKELGVTTFKIDKLDAYFEVSKITSTVVNANFYETVEAVNVPSDFNLVMTDNTHLRTFPNGRRDYALFALRDVSNVTIIGGNLHGGRDAHDYSSGGSHEWGHVFQIKASSNIVIDGVKMLNGVGDGMSISALNFSFQPNYRPSHDIIIKNCIFDLNRRSNMSITDGYNILIENNQFLNAGRATSQTEGATVGFAINIEAERRRDSNGNLVFYERAYDITIKNNVERGSRGSGFGISIGEKITIEGNDMEKSISYLYTSDSKIINNKFKSIGGVEGKTAIVAGGIPSESISNNTISGNHIDGYGTGIIMYDQEIEVSNNTIENCINGINFVRIRDCQITGNIINSTHSSSRGIGATLTHANNVIIEGNEISVKKDQLNFVHLNNKAGEENNKVTIQNNKFLSKSKVTLENSKGLDFNNNNLVGGGMQLINTSKIKLNSNTIASEISHGIHLRESNSVIDINSNTISVTGNFSCTKTDSGSSQINIPDSNTCN
ncbi:right-handed parallel beta-helix repeat-containing protein [Flavivirga rizhaonensis]|nr:right-handed parallel beta-helix repeat-containing protein [Flavivirga rizhaonensis]